MRERGRERFQRTGDVLLNVSESIRLSGAAARDSICCDATSLITKFYCDYADEVKIVCIFHSLSSATTWILKFIL